MKYAVAKCVNSNFEIVSEWNDKNGAYTSFHSVCTTLYNAPDVNHATVVVIDEKFRVYKIEYIKYDEEV